jgi:hypothetical protein
MKSNTSSLITKIWTYAVLLLATFVVLSAARAAQEEEVLVFTDARQGIRTPTSEHPIYYLAMPAKGATFTKIGPFLPQKADETLTADQVWPLIEKALDRQGFRNVLRVKPRSAAPKPDILIVFQWGGVKRDIGMVMKTTNNASLMALLEALEEAGSEAAHDYYNVDEVGEVLGVQGADRNSPEFATVQAASQGERYYITVTAYDFETANRSTPKKKLMWRARMSTEASPYGLVDVLQPMISAGGPLFGKNSIYPKQVSWDRAKVEVGETVVVPDVVSANSKVIP